MTQGDKSDLFDFPFREYHAGQGRWISPDPIGMAAASLVNPQSWNRYSYTMNNPVLLTDPLGTSCENPTDGTPCVVDVKDTAPTVPTFSVIIASQLEIGAGYIEPPGRMVERIRRAANNGKSHGCAATRIAKGVQGVVNIGLGELKTAGAIGVGLLGAGGAPETGGASLSATLAAGYIAISSQGQVLSGGGQLYSAISGNVKTGEQIQQVGDIMSGPISGISTLVASNNTEAAALAANAESALTLGAGAFNSETVADRTANGVDAALTFFGLEQGNCQVP